MEYLMHTVVTLLTTGGLITLFAVVESACKGYLNGSSAGK